MVPRRSQPAPSVPVTKPPYHTIHNRVRQPGGAGQCQSTLLFPTPPVVPSAAGTTASPRPHSPWAGAEARQQSPGPGESRQGTPGHRPHTAPWGSQPVLIRFRHRGSLLCHPHFLVCCCGCVTPHPPAHRSQNRLASFLQNSSFAANTLATTSGSGWVWTRHTRARRQRPETAVRAGVQ